MSLILDALNKSERDRDTPDAAPGLGAVHGPVAGVTRSWRSYAWPALTLALLVLAVVPWLVREPAPAPVVPPIDTIPSVVVKPASPAVAEVVVAVAPEPEPEPAAPPVMDRADVAALYRDAGAPEPAVAAPAGQPAAAVQQSRQSVAPPPALDVNALTRAAEQALAEQGQEPLVESHAAPLIADLSQRQKDEIPTIYFSAHAWSSIPAERSVVLNGERRRAGDTIKPGLTLVEILPDSIVMDYRGTEFRLRALNSWVNL